MRDKTKPASYIKLYLERLVFELMIFKVIFRNEKGATQIEALEKSVEGFFVNSLLLFLCPAIYSLTSYRSPHLIEGILICFVFGIILMFIQMGFVFVLKKMKFAKLRVVSAFLLMTAGVLFGRTLFVL